MLSPVSPVNPEQQCFDRTVSTSRTVPDNPDSNALTEKWDLLRAAEQTFFEGGEGSSKSVWHLGTW